MSAGTGEGSLHVLRRAPGSGEGRGRPGCAAASGARTMGCMDTYGNWRVSEAEREPVIERLKSAYAVGRIPLPGSRRGCTVR